MRKKYIPHTASCLVRYEEMERLKELEGTGFFSRDGKRLLTPQEMAYVLNVSPSSVANMVRDNRIQPVVIESAVRFTVDELMRFIGANYYETV